METAFSQLTVCFEAPFWVCLYERIEQGRQSRARTGPFPAGSRALP